MSEGRQFAPRKSIGNWAGYNEGLKKRYDITRVTADGIYDTWGCYKAAHDHGAEIVVPPRKNAVEPDEATGRADHPCADAIRETKTKLRRFRCILRAFEAALTLGGP